MSEAAAAGSARVAADHDQHGPDRHDVALGDADARHLPRRRGRDLDGRLVGLDLDERLVLGDLVALGHQPAGDLALGQALAEIGQLELVRHGVGGYLRGRPIQASAGTTRMRRPSPARQSDTACSLPSSSAVEVARHVPRLERALLVPDRNGVRVVLVLGLRHEREAPARIERRVGDRLGAERDPGDRHDANARVLPRHPLTGRGVAQVVARAAAVALEPEPEAPAQKKVRTAAATRAAEGT